MLARKSHQPDGGRTKKSRGLRIGVIDLLADAAPRSLGERVYAGHFRRQFAGLMPQAISVWCRQAGHQVFYATYYGQAEPGSLVPEDIDLVFVSAYTKASALAYALARLFKRRGVTTVIGGPHAKSFPDDCLRFYDIVVADCDRQTVADIVQGHHAPGSTVSAAQPLRELPTIEERMPELYASHLSNGDRSLFTLIPLIASLGCPYRCNFCVDATNDYVSLSSERLRADLEFVSTRFPGQFIAFHDPNFGVRFDEVMAVMESFPPGRRSPYAIQASMSILKEPRMARLRDTNCVYIAPGVESWNDYSNKAGAGSRTGHDKWQRVVDQFRMMGRYIRGYQANFVFGTDVDKGYEPVRLTKAFMRELPGVWPGISIATPFGGTGLFEELRAAGRLLESMPFAFYYNPYLTFLPAHYDPVEYYEHLIDLFSTLIDPGLWARRLGSRNPWKVRLMHGVQAFGARNELREFRRIRRLLKNDRQFRAFHEGRDRRLPGLYQHRLRNWLGSYAELLSNEDLVPILTADSSNQAAAMHVGSVISG
ncbi:MAG: radical SAM protein [Pseudomonadota bacterium]